MLREPSVFWAAVAAGAGQQSPEVLVVIALNLMGDCCVSSETAQCNEYEVKDCDDYRMCE